jgi:hypothetical protein
MGALDDAIREHLELKRRHGASEEEVTQQEKEALDVGALPPDERDLSPELGEAEAHRESEPEGEPVEEPADPSATALAEPAAPAAPVEPAQSSALPDELEPDEVLPEEALETEAAALEQPRPDRAGETEPEPDWTPERQANGGMQTEDVLEETPEFLEETPEHDRLWFEQRPPKDFDFDD